MQSTNRSAHPFLFRVILGLLLLALLCTPWPSQAQTEPPQPTPSAPVEALPDASAELLTNLEAQLSVAIQRALSEFAEPVSLLSLTFDGAILTIDLGGVARTMADQERFPELLEPINTAVNAVLSEAGLAEQRSLEYRFLIDGQPLVAEAPAAPLPEKGDAPNPDAINSQRIVINPGHGYYNTGSSWALQRGYWWGIVEDFINVEFAILLQSKLRAVGADARATRELNKNAGNHSSGKALWQMGSAAYTRHINAPSWVWSGGASGLAPDIMARPYYANYLGAKATISIHNNGGRGCGTETWFDTSNAYRAQSEALARAIQAKIIQRVRAQWNVNWCDRGAKGSNGGYGEIRAVNGPAVLIEIGFMDTSSDNQSLQNATFRNIVAQAISDATTEYFGGVACPLNQYRAEYFANTSLSGSPAFVRCESGINNAWGSGGPGNGLANDNFSVRWTGRHNFAASTYAFVATADDGVRVSVDGYRLIDAWRDQAPTQYRASRGLQAGYHTVVVEYYERGGGATAQLFWSNNIALLSPAYATSQQSSSYPAAFGNDVSWTTRWASAQSLFLGDQWWWTKIGPRQTITEVRVSWETAYAADHCIAWWSDGDANAQMYCYAISAPGRYTYPIGVRTAQYVGVLMRKRAPWHTGYSLFDVSAFRWGGTLNSAPSEEIAPGIEVLPEGDPIEIAIPTFAAANATNTIYLPLVIAE